MNAPNELYETYAQLTQTACYGCGAAGGDLQACSRCRVRIYRRDEALSRQRASFCSRACAAKAWTKTKPHKAYCRAWAEAIGDRGDDEAAETREDNMRLIMAGMSALGPRLSGTIPPRPLANDLVYYEARCFGCCSASAGGTRALQLCDDCGVARWCERCEPDGKRAHLADRDEGGRLQCEVLREALADQSICLLYHGDPNRPGPLLITQPETCLDKPEPLPASWDDYLASWDCDAPPPFDRTMTTLSLSFPLTVIAAIERFELLQRFDASVSGPITELEVHLVGAEVEVELALAGPTWEQLLHRLPSVKRLRLVFVGPGIKPGEQGTVDHDCCPKCTRAGRTRTVIMHRVRRSIEPTLKLQGAYHDVFSDASTTVPTIAIALNSGCHEAPRSWRPTIELLLARRVPTVFTSLQATEAQDDARLIRSIAGDRVLWAEERNPFREEHAHIDPFSPHGVWRRNSHWLGFR